MTLPKLPLPEPLRGAQIGSFAHTTVTQRMPELGRLALAENDFPPHVVARLERLLSEIPESPLRPLDDPGAPDVDDWNRALVPYTAQDWLQVPWFVAETYFYRRILEASGYFQPGVTHRLDPYFDQKYKMLAVSQPVIRALCAQVNGLERASARQAHPANALSRLLVPELLFRQNLWGNQADLSMWPAGQSERPDHQDWGTQQSHILADHSSAVLDHLLNLGRPAQVIFIIDNAGLELVNDLALADALLSSHLAGEVIFHLKIHPTFISDATIWDVRRTVELLVANAEIEVRAFAQRLIAYLVNGCLRLTDHPFWTSPLPFWEMPESLREELSRADLLISKGDANYRRLLGDAHWRPTTPFGDVLGYVPAPLLAIRVCKAEIVVGLRAEQIEHLDRADPAWLVNGHWGVIQFVKPN